ncbi:hypothetical protein DPMN_177039 [Dreissena polymorpha]|uniref:Uncharacterized protein n=1 Tax=Dreissena polymorpha TaxID=45954 RepID=A0A9D4EA97_DREPO|nr:hypothetical protein DPMN_177039 [Dreissena polymorpha]
MEVVQAFNGKGGSDADYDLDINLDFGEKSETELNKAEWLRGPQSPKNNTNSYRGNKPQENGLPAIKEKSAPRVSPSRRLPESDVKYAPIDHASKAARLREQNLVKYRDKYGDDDMK